jgi:hypothetical protein
MDATVSQQSTERRRLDCETVPFPDSSSASTLLFYQLYHHQHQILDFNWISLKFNSRVAAGFINWLSLTSFYLFELLIKLYFAKTSYI